MSVASLSAVSGDMGTLTAGKISVGSTTIDADSERILMGAASAPLTGTGVFLGKDGTDYEFRVGNPSGDFIHWDGSTWTVFSSIDNPPRVYNCFATGSWNGSGTDYSVSWSTSDKDGGETIGINYYRGGALVGSDSGLTDDGSHNKTISGGSSSEKIYVVVILKNSGGGVMDSKETGEIAQTI